MSPSRNPCAPWGDPQGRHNNIFLPFQYFDVFPHITATSLFCWSATFLLTEQNAGRKHIIHCDWMPSNYVVGFLVFFFFFFISQIKPLCYLEQMLNLGLLLVWHTHEILNEKADWILNILITGTENNWNWESLKCFQKEETEVGFAFRIPDHTNHVKFCRINARIYCIILKWDLHGCYFKMAVENNFKNKAKSIFKSRLQILPMYL